MPTDAFEQPGRCRLEWGRHGARRAAERGDAIVVVDTLSFSSAVVTAVHHGALIYPCSSAEESERLGRVVDAEVAVQRHQVPVGGRFSLSPATFLNVEAGTRVAVASPNGATCCRNGSDAPLLLVGALLNAGAVAHAVSSWMSATKQNVTVLCCGERWHEPNDDGPLRVAVEDYLGAGAILSRLGYPHSPEARVCAAAFQGMRGELSEIIFECASGRELRTSGFPEDVRYAAQLDIITSVPIWQDGALRRWANERIAPWM